MRIALFIPIKPDRRGSIFTKAATLCTYRPLIFGNIKIVVNKGSGDAIFGMLTSSWSEIERLANGPGFIRSPAVGRQTTRRYRSSKSRTPRRIRSILTAQIVELKPKVRFDQRLILLIFGFAAASKAGNLRYPLVVTRRRKRSVIYANICTNIPRFINICAN